jgi:hypothetical protein
MEFLKRFRLLFFSLVVLPLAPHPLPAAPPTPNEYALKAVFLYNFVRFIDWPNSAFHSANDPLVIGIVGPDPFDSLIYEAIAGENYRGRPIQVEHFKGARDIRHCHLLFVSRANAGELDQILAAVANHNVLTVGETENFLNHGGMIALVTEQNRVRLRINAAAVYHTQLTVSSKLMQVAQIQY